MVGISVQNRHTCHWPGCEIIVDPRMWGCRRHWFTLPGYLRRAIWKAYRPGQETTKDPSHEYILAAERVQWWCHGYQHGQMASPIRAGNRDWLDGYKAGYPTTVDPGLPARHVPGDDLFAQQAPIGTIVEIKETEHGTEVRARLSPNAPRPFLSRRRGRGRWPR